MDRLNSKVQHFAVYGLSLDNRYERVLKWHMKFEDCILVALRARSGYVKIGWQQVAGN